MLYCDGRGRDIRTVEDYQAVLHREKDGFSVAQIPVLSGCCAATGARERAAAESDSCERF
jgi:hypothetical protein